MDQDLPKETLLASSSFYRQGRCSKVYTHWKFWLTMLDAFYQSAVVFFMAYGVGCPIALELVILYVQLSEPQNKDIHRNFAVH